MLLNNKRFELFFNTYYEPVYLFSLKYVREEPVAQDIAQNVFVRLYEKRENFYAIEKAKSFAYTTAHNLCLNHLRHSQIAQKYISQREEEEEQSCLYEITYQETLRLLSFAISQLPRKPGKLSSSVWRATIILKSQIFCISLSTPSNQ